MGTSLAITASIVALSAVAFFLSAAVLRRFLRQRQLYHLYWGVGLFLVFVTLAQEAALYGGFWSQLLIRSYLVLVALLVGVLSLGSAELSLPRVWKKVWFGYIAVACLALGVIGAFCSVSPSIVVTGVVSGVPSPPVLVASSLVTIPGAALLILSSLYGALREKRYHLLYITFGTVIISASGALYLVAFPVSLYYAEFLGIALLFLGFVKIPGIRLRTAHAATS
jgi:hypothetical protein